MANWTRRTTTKTGKNTRRTVTQRMNGASTFSSSYKQGNTRYTESRTPGGKTKYTVTTKNGPWTKRETRTFGASPRKSKVTRSRSGRRSGDGAVSLIFWIISLIALLIFSVRR